jgi:hypothetical protein
LVPPEAVLSDLGKPPDFQYTRSGDYGNHAEPTAQLELNAHLGYGTGGGLSPGFTVDLSFHHFC